MAKKLNAKQKNKRLLLIFGGLAIIIALAIAYRLSGYAQTGLSKQPTNTVAPTPTLVMNGNEAKTAQSSSTPAPTSNSGNQAKSSTAPVTKGSYIQEFVVSARQNGQFASTTLSAGANCSITLTPSTGNAVTKTGPVISTGSTLSCDFGGVIDVQGHGTTRLTVTGAGGKIDTKETTF